MYSKENWTTGSAQITRTTFKIDPSSLSLWTILNPFHFGKFLIFYFQITFLAQHFKIIYRALHVISFCTPAAKSFYRWIFLNDNIFLWCLYSSLVHVWGRQVVERYTLHISNTDQCLVSSELLTPHPLSTQRVCPPPASKAGGGRYILARRSGGGGVNSSEDARHWIGLLQYNPSTHLWNGIWRFSYRDGPHRMFMNVWMYLLDKER
jgi:hypothetical protein